MLEMGVNAIRTAHYPHDQLTYDLADENGMLIYNEIPYYLLFSKKQSYKDSIINQLKEMIRQGYNHPSIIMWGCLNEVMYNKSYAMYGDDFDITKGELVDFNRKLIKLAKNEDTGRLIVQGNIDYEWSAQDTALWSENIDITGFNLYRGFKSPINKTDATGRNDIIASLNATIDSYKKILNTDQIMLSEYGAGANVEQHTELDENFSWAGNDAVQTHYQELQTYVLETYLQFINSRNDMPLSFVWNMFDFSCYRNEGGTNRLNTKGLVGYDHQTKKDAYYLYKAAWNKKDKFVWLTDKRFTKRNKRYQNIKAYSNCEKVELFVNGVSHGDGEKQQDGVFTWDKVHFDDSTDLKVIAHDGKAVYTDSIENITTKGYGYQKPLKTDLNYEIKDEMYDGKKKTVKVTGPSSMGAISVKYYSDSSYSNEVEEVKNVGTYYVKAFVEKAVYNEKTNLFPFDAGEFELGEWKILKADNKKEPDVKAVDETIYGKSDGKITGVDSGMEYKASTDTEYQNCIGSEIINLKPGTYYVRYKAAEGYNAGKEKEVVIGEGRWLNVQFSTPYGTLQKINISVAYAQKLSKPDIKEVLGYKFMGWFKDKSLSSEWKFEEDVVYEDMVLYAKWDANNVVQSPVPTIAPTNMPGDLPKATSSPTVIPTSKPTMPTIQPTKTPDNINNVSKKKIKLNIVADWGSKNIKIDTVKNSTVKITLTDRIILSGKKKVRTVKIPSSKNKTGKITIKLSKKLVKGKKVRVSVSKEGYETKTITKTVKAAKKINKLNISISKNRKQIVIMTLKKSKIEVNLSEKIILDGKIKVKKLTVKAGQNKNGVVKVKFSRKIKNKKIIVTVSKSGYKTRNKIIS